MSSSFVQIVRKRLLVELNVQQAYIIINTAAQLFLLFGFYIININIT